MIDVACSATASFGTGWMIAVLLAARHSCRANMQAAYRRKCAELAELAPTLRDVEIPVNNVREIPLLIVDLDGTVREGKDDPLGRFVNGPEDVRVFPEAREQIRRWRDAGGRVVAVSNQGGIALGLVDEDQVDAAILETRRQVEYPIDGVFVCPHHPAAKTPGAAHCWCRKPSPGLVFVAVQELMEAHDDEIYPPALALMVGDRPEDEECAPRAGIAFRWAADWRAEVRA